MSTFQIGVTFWRKAEGLGMTTTAHEEIDFTNISSGSFTWTMSCLSLGYQGLYQNCGKLRRAHTRKPGCSLTFGGPSNPT